ncbi:MAG: carboxypeptidase M32 [Bacteroidia bacterium]|nr:carboxypeptidase M32 [Bacteroidia bacterium]
MDLTAEYEEFRRLSAHLADLSAALSVLQWDLETMAPPAAAQRRAGQIGALAGLRHEFLLERYRPVVMRLAEAAQSDETKLYFVHRRNILAAAETVEKAAALPADFVSDMARTCAQAQSAWERAKNDDDFASFEPHLEAIVELKREQARLYRQAMPGRFADDYSALLDDYEPGMSAAEVDELFARLTPELRRLTALAPAAEPRPLFTQDPDSAAQLKLCRKVLSMMGFDFGRGRMDVSAHPFTTSFGPEDVRITTRVVAGAPLSALYSALHEGGHALYEQGLSPVAYGLPEGEACSLSIHESQSRIWENNVGRSYECCRALFDDVAILSPNRLAGFGPEDLFRCVNVVRPSLIRTEADELTYHFHIVVRYELEREMLSGALRVRDVPEAWRERYAQYLSVRPPNDTKGALQDVHWAHGSFGYFPTYTLGSLFAAQFFSYALDARPSLPQDIAEGRWTTLTKYLSENIFLYGRIYPSQTLCVHLGGEKLNADYFVRYMEAKLTALNHR